MQANSATRAKRMVLDFMLFGGFGFCVESKNGLEFFGCGSGRGIISGGWESVYIDGLRTIVRACQDEGA